MQVESSICRIQLTQIYCTQFMVMSKNLRVFLLQDVNGSPENPLLQIQEGLWFLTLQYAFWPQTPGQGSLHFCCIQARLSGHSELIVHSGLHSMYGFPLNPGKQEQDAAEFLSRHSALIPHGEGLQGSITSGRGGGAKIHRRSINLEDWFGWKHTLNYIQRFRL